MLSEILLALCSKVQNLVTPKIWTFCPLNPKNVNLTNSLLAHYPWLIQIPKDPKGPNLTFYLDHVLWFWSLRFGRCFSAFQLCNLLKSPEKHCRVILIPALKRPWEEKLLWERSTFHLTTKKIITWLYRGMELETIHDGQSLSSTCVPISKVMLSVQGPETLIVQFCQESLTWKNFFLVSAPPPQPLEIEIGFWGKSLKIFSPVRTPCPSGNRT